MTILSAALEAREKATKGPWVIGGSYTVRTPLLSNDWICRTRDVRHGHYDIEDNANAVVIAAAPDALDWIAKALPWIVEKAGETKELLKRIRTEEDAGEWNKEIPGLEEDLETLTALIAQAEGGK